MCTDALLHVCIFVKQVNHRYSFHLIQPAVLQLRLHSGGKLNAGPARGTGRFRQQPSVQNVKRALQDPFFFQLKWSYGSENMLTLITVTIIRRATFELQ